MLQNGSDVAKGSRKVPKKGGPLVDMKSLLVLGCTLSFVGIFIALYNKTAENEARERLQNVLVGLLKVERRHSIINPQVAIGYGSCKDLVFEALDLQLFNCSKSIVGTQDSITSLEELEEAFCYYFQHGAASEWVMYSDRILFFYEFLIHFYFQTVHS